MQTQGISIIKSLVCPGRGSNSGPPSRPIPYSISMYITLKIKDMTETTAIHPIVVAYSKSPLFLNLIDAHFSHSQQTFIKDKAQ